MSVIRQDVHELTNWLRVTLDGVEIDPCFECDPDRGYVITVDRNAEGLPIPDGSSPVKFKLKKLTGAVGLTLQLNAPPHLNQLKVINQIKTAAARMRLESFLSIQSSNREVLLRQGYMNVIMGLYQRDETKTHEDIQEKARVLLKRKTQDLIQELQQCLELEYQRQTTKVKPVTIPGIQ